MRVVITGMGVISPAGVGAHRLGAALRRGESFTRRIGGRADGREPGEIGAPVPDFEARDFLEGGWARKLDRSAQLFVGAARMALEEAALSTSALDADRVGVYEGTSLGGLRSALSERWPPRPTALTRVMTGTGASMVSILHGVTGPVFTYSNGSAASACALKGAVDQLRLNEIDVAVVGGAEAPLSPPVLAAFRRARLLASRRKDPGRACRPFDASRDGIVLGEGAAVFVLERRDDARSRGARVLGEILAIALTNDACSLVAPDPGGREQGRAIRRALGEGGAHPDQLDYVSAHGTGTRLNDRVETIALKEGLGAHATRVAVSSSKSMLGHALGASTALELAKTIIALEDGFIPPTINLENPDPECDLDYVPRHSRAARIVLALVNNSSFGGKNCSILVRRPDASPSDSARMRSRADRSTVTDARA